MKALVFLVEERSMEVVLNELVPRILEEEGLSNEFYPQVIFHEGKSDLIHY
jgi:hypothetical protein